MDGIDVQQLKGQLLDRREKLESAIAHTSETDSLVGLLNEVDRALEKISIGTYGLCETCHDSIEKDRLAVDPLVRFCLDHLSKVEQQFLERDLTLASNVQTTLLPKQDLIIKGWRTAHLYRPAGPVSGDYFDLIVPEDPQARSSLCFSIGDISGKGIAASILMAHLHAILRSLMKTDRQLKDIVEHANRLFSESTAQKNFATLVFGRSDHDGHLELCNAAHCSPLIIHRDSVEKAPATGFPLGLFARGTYSTWSTTLYHGDVIFLYTDGLVEARNAANDLYGEQRLAALLKKAGSREPKELIDICLADLSSFSNGNRQIDDLTLFVLQYQ